MLSLTSTTYERSIDATGKLLTANNINILLTCLLISRKNPYLYLDTAYIGYSSMNNAINTYKNHSDVCPGPEFNHTSSTQSCEIFCMI